MLYVRSSKALYGILRAALLFYKRLNSDFENMGFKIKPYDPCVAKKIVNSHQMTIFWHVDDLTVSHKEENYVTALAEKLADLYGPKTTDSRGKVHKYLWMDIDWSSVPGALIVSMIKYLHKEIEESLKSCEEQRLHLLGIICSPLEKTAKGSCSQRNKRVNSTARWRS